MPPITCECGTCPKCKHRIYMREYYRRPGVAAKVSAQGKRYRQEHLEQQRAYDRQRAKRHKQATDPLKLRAGKNLRNGVWRGADSKAALRGLRLRRSRGTS